MPSKLGGLGGWEVVSEKERKENTLCCERASPPSFGARLFYCPATKCAEAQVSCSLADPRVVTSIKPPTRCNGSGWLSAPGSAGAEKFPRPHRLILGKQLCRRSLELSLNPDCSWNCFFLGCSQSAAPSPRAGCGAGGGRGAGRAGQGRPGSLPAASPAWHAASPDLQLRLGGQRSPGCGCMCEFMRAAPDRSGGGESRASHSQKQ